MTTARAVINSSKKDVPSKHCLDLNGKLAKCFCCYRILFGVLGG